MPRPPFGIVAHVTRICRSNGEVPFELGSHVTVVVNAAQVVIAACLKLAVPAPSRHPDFEPDLRIADGRRDTDHAAERRQPVTDTARDSGSDGLNVSGDYSLRRFQIRTFVRYSLRCSERLALQTELHTQRAQRVPSKCVRFQCRGFFDNWQEDLTRG
jgi:hypothetical protein